MPLRDSSGKRLSGAAEKRRKKAQQEDIRKAETQRKKLKSSKDLSASSDNKPVGLEFEDLPPPDLNDSSGAIAWWNRVLLVCADKVLRDPVLSLEQKIKYLHDGAAKAGMIRDKAAEQEQIKKLLAEQQGKKAAVGLEDVSQLAPPRISRPAG